MPGRFVPPRICPVFMVGNVKNSCSGNTIVTLAHHRGYRSCAGLRTARIGFRLVDVQSSGRLLESAHQAAYAWCAPQPISGQQDNRRKMAAGDSAGVFGWPLFTAWHYCCLRFGRCAFRSGRLVLLARQRLRLVESPTTERLLQRGQVQNRRVPSMKRISPHSIWRTPHASGHGWRTDRQWAGKRDPRLLHWAVVSGWSALR